MPTRKKSSAKSLTVNQRRKQQTGRSNNAKDKMYKAKHPGSRTSKSGRQYTENRANRSDADRTKRI